MLLNQMIANYMELKHHTSELRVTTDIIALEKITHTFMPESFIHVFPNTMPFDVQQLSALMSLAMTSAKSCKSFQWQKHISSKQCTFLTSPRIKT